MSSYDVMVYHEDGMWVADIAGEGLGPVATDVEHFADLDVEVRDLIAGLTDTDPDEFTLAWRHIIGGVDVTEEINTWARSEEELAEASAGRDAARAAVIRQLSRHGASQSTIGDVLGLSHQRVHQLAVGLPAAS